jgi:hypothetical protein
MNFGFKSEHQIELNSSPMEFLQKLNEVTLTKYGTGKVYDYEGKINFEDHSFEILQLFEYGNRNYNRPSLSGQIKGNTCYIKIDAIPLIKIYIGWMAICCFLIIPSFLIWEPFKMDLPSSTAFRILIGPLFFFIGWGIALALHKSKVSDSLDYLARLANES